MSAQTRNFSQYSTLAMAALVLGIAAPQAASASGAQVSAGTFTINGVSTLGSPGTGAPSNSGPAASVLAPIGGTVTGYPAQALSVPQPSASGSRGVDEKWGDPLDTDLFDSGTMRARVNYYFGNGNGQGSGQGGVGISLTFPN